MRNNKAVGRVDLRDLLREVQEIAFRKGMILYIPPPKADSLRRVRRTQRPTTFYGSR